MRELVWSKTFLRASKRLIRKQPAFRVEIERTLRLLVENPFDPRLATHKLHGKLKGKWACSVAYDLRIVFMFTESLSGDLDDIFLIEIGTHNEVY